MPTLSWKGSKVVTFVKSFCRRDETSLQGQNQTHNHWCIQAACLLSLSTRSLPTHHLLLLSVEGVLAGTFLSRQVQLDRAFPGLDREPKSRGSGVATILSAALSSNFSTAWSETRRRRKQRRHRHLGRCDVAVFRRRTGELQPPSLGVIRLQQAPNTGSRMPTKYKQKETSHSVVYCRTFGENVHSCSSILVSSWDRLCSYPHTRLATTHTHKNSTDTKRRASFRTFR